MVNFADWSFMKILASSHVFAVTFVTMKTARKYPFEVKSGSSIVKVYKLVSPERTRFTVAWHEGPHRKLKQITDEEEALEEAKVIAGKLNAGQGSALSLTG